MWPSALPYESSFFKSVMKSLSWNGGVITEHQRRGFEPTPRMRVKSVHGSRMMNSGSGDLALIESSKGTG